MKKCPKCSKEHDKKGRFCSRSCANSREWTDNDKNKKSKTLLDFWSSSDSDNARKRVIESAMNQNNTEEQRLKRSNARKASWTQERRKKASENAKKQICSEEKKIKLSRLAHERGFGGHTSKKKLYFEKKTGEVVYLQSSYEIMFAELLEKLNLEWSRPDPLVWVDKFGIHHRYYPDFKVGSAYFDTKNDYLIIKDFEKIQSVIQQNNVTLHVVSKDNITEDFIARLT